MSNDKTRRPTLKERLRKALAESLTPDDRRSIRAFRGGMCKGMRAAMVVYSDNGAEVLDVVVKDPNPAASEASVGPVSGVDDKRGYVYGWNTKTHMYPADMAADIRRALSSEADKFEAEREERTHASHAARVMYVKNVQALFVRPEVSLVVAMGPNRLVLATHFRSEHQVDCDRLDADALTRIQAGSYLLAAYSLVS